jgi:hypothetical protein
MLAMHTGQLFLLLLVNFVAQFEPGTRITQRVHPVIETEDSLDISIADMFV